MLAFVEHIILNDMGRKKGGVSLRFLLERPCLNADVPAFKRSACLGEVNLRARGSSALREATREGHANVIKLLLKEIGIKISARDNNRSRTPIRKGVV